MKRIVYIFISFVLLATNTVFNFAAADDTSTPCQACTTTSSYIDRYTEFAYEIISTLQTFANTESSMFQSENNPNAGTSESSTNQGLKTLEAIADNLNRKAQSIASAGYVASLITTEGALLNTWKGLGLLVQNEALTRDWQKIDNVDQRVTNTLLDLGNAGVFIRLGFKPGLTDRIKSILQKYSAGSDAIITIDPETYSSQPIALLGALWRIDQNLKTLITYGNTISSDEDNSQRNITEFTYLNKQLSLSEGFKQEMGGDGTNPGYYSCARSTRGITACSKLGKQANKQFDAIWKQTTSEAKDAQTVIKNSIKRLQGFRAKEGGTTTEQANKQALIDRQNELLRGQYGWKGIHDTSGTPIVQGFWDAYKAVKSDITSAGGLLDGLSAKPADKAPIPFKVGDIAASVITQDKEKGFLAVAIAVNTAAYKARTESIFSDITPLTKTFPILSTELTKSQYILAGGSPTSVMNNLGQACELQCSNVGGRCWATQ